MLWSGGQWQILVIFSVGILVLIVGWGGPFPMTYQFFHLWYYLMVHECSGCEVALLVSQPQRVEPLVQRVVQPERDVGVGPYSSRQFPCNWTN